MSHIATYELFISYAEADNAWVQGVLLDVLVQAGVQCRTEEAFALGQPRILEFEHAVRESERTLLVLSPAYLAEGFSRFTDVLAECYQYETDNWRVIPLILHPVHLPPRLAMLTGLDATNPLTWPAVIKRLCGEFQRPVPPAPKLPCPYPGMVPFKAAQYFYGRESEIENALLHLRHQRELYVIGPSGSGKSSLLFAGILPRLRESRAYPEGFWLIQQMRPGAQPVETLVRTLGGDLSQLDQAVAALLAAQPGAQRLLLVVDQFEELFTQAAHEEQARFIAAIKALQAVESCTLIIAMRADFYPDLMNSELWPVEVGRRLEIGPLRGEALRQALEQPATDVGAYVEAGLLERLLADAADEPGALPLLQETMILLWEKMVRRLLPLYAYDQLGGEGRNGLAVATATWADATFAGLSPEQQALARRIFLRLVQFGEGRADTRRRQPISALRSAGDDPALFEQTIRCLADNRLLTLSGQAGDPERQVDIAHEVLFVAWPTLHDWVKERRVAEQTRRRLAEKGAEWVRLGRGSGGLLDEIELLEAERWLAGPDAAELGYDPMLPELVQASRKAIEQEREQEAARQRHELEQAQALAAEQRQRAEAQHQRAEVQARTARRLRFGAAVLGVVAMIAVVAAVLAIQQNRLATSLQLAAQAKSHENQPDLALLLSLAANQIKGTDDTREGLRTLLEANPRITTFLHGRATPMKSVAFSPDGKTLASGSGDEDGRIILWDVEKHQQSGELLTDHHEPVTSVAFSPADGSILASGSDDRTIILWNVEKRQRLGDALTGHKERVSSVAFSPDGKTLASGSADNTIILWNVASHQRLGDPLEVHAKGVRSVAFSPDGKTLAAGYGDGSIILWDVASHQQIGTLTDHTGSVNSVTFSRDGTTLASGSDDGSIFLWDVASRQRLGDPLRDHTAAVYSVAFSPAEGKILAAGSADNTVTLWDVAGHQRLGDSLKGHTDKVWSVAFSPDGKTLAAGSEDKSIILWDLATYKRLGEPLTGHNGYITTVAFNLADGNILASGSFDHTIILWDVEKHQPIGTPLTGHKDRITSLAFSPDGKTLASGSADNTIILWDVANHQRLGDLLGGQTKGVCSVAFNRDGTILAAGNGDGTIILWNVANHQPIGAPLRDNTNRVCSVAFSPDGATLASGSGNGNGHIILWNVANHQQIGDLVSDGTKGVNSVAFSPPDGQILASGNGDGSIILWDVANRQRLGGPLKGHSAPVRSVAFSPADGTTLASGSEDNTVIVWDLTKRLGYRLTGHTNQVWGVAFSPNGKTLASGGDDKTIILWDAASHQRLEASLTGRRGSVNSVAFSPVGKVLAAGSEGEMSISRNPDFKTWQAQACRIANRNLTSSEIDQYISKVSFLSKLLYRKPCSNPP